MFFSIISIYFYVCSGVIKRGFDKKLLYCVSLCIEKILKAGWLLLNTGFGPSILKANFWIQYIVIPNEKYGNKLVMCFFCIKVWFIKWSLCTKRIRNGCCVTSCKFKLLVTVVDYPAAKSRNTWYMMNWWLSTITTSPSNDKDKSLYFQHGEAINRFW